MATHPMIRGDREINAETAAMVQFSHRYSVLVWTVTTNTFDHGRRFVARPHKATGDGSGPLSVYLIADTLDALREKLPSGLVRMDRQPEDERVIVEFWL